MSSGYRGYQWVRWRVMKLDKRRAARCGDLDCKCATCTTWGCPCAEENKR